MEIILSVVSYTKNCYSFSSYNDKIIILLKIIKTLRAITEKAIMPRAVDFHEEKARKTSFLTKEHTCKVCDCVKNEVFCRFLP